MDDEQEIEDTLADTTTFEEWVELMAGSKGIEEKQLYEQLVAAYWVLDEIVGLVGRVDTANEGATRDSSTGPARSLSDDRPLEPPSIDLIEQLQTSIETLEERLDALEGSNQDGDASTEEIRTHVEETAAFVEELADRQTTLHTDVAQEFDHIRVILEYLIESTEDHASHADRTVEAIASLKDRADHTDESVAEIRHLLASTEQLDLLKQQASRLGVTAADCENCAATIKLPLLATPQCPHCERQFVGLERSGGRWPFSSNTLNVREEPERDRRQALTWNEQHRGVGRFGSRHRIAERREHESAFRWLTEDQLADRN